ncbi:hypothetical protein Micbo1qcDRAFT_235746 [Microdochium bolleyi]|uniref:Uncharacterized protein n=1 Tax=Microdochium bolleyi TaxID=196109 RepID=A0A136IU92_9PEZI|nr:hypothetical protein Micbo1qcDRAFT_235746 [Microdochium bolleyi]
MDNNPLLSSYIAQLHGTHLDTALLALKHAVKSGDAQQVVMAIPMLLALTICPAMLGTQEAIRQSQSKTKREEHRAQRCNLVASCVKPSIRAADINGKLIVLNGGKLYIANQTVNTGHPFSGYFLPYPDSKFEGVVSTITESATPQLNWIYVDRETYAVKHGLRVDAQDHVTGPFDCTRQDRRMTLEGWEGFVAVEETPGVWALYFDKDDNGLRGKVPFGTRVLEIELTRREKKERKPKENEGQATTLDEMMEQHKEKVRREEEESHEASVEDGSSVEKPSATCDSTEDGAEVDWSHLKVARDDEATSAGSRTAVPSIYGDECLPSCSVAKKQTDEGYKRPTVVKKGDMLADALKAISDDSSPTEGIAELVVTALGSGGQYYICWRTQLGAYKQRSHALPQKLEQWLFPNDGSTRDFESLQVILYGDDTFLARDQGGEIRSDDSQAAVSNPRSRFRRATTMSEGTAWLHRKSAALRQPDAADIQHKRAMSADRPPALRPRPLSLLSAGGGGSGSSNSSNSGLGSNATDRPRSLLAAIDQYEAVAFAVYDQRES